MVTNGDFSSNTDWSFIGDTIIQNGVAEFPTSTNSFLIQSNVVALSVKTYKLQYEVITTNGNNFRLAGGNSAFGLFTLDSATIGVKTIYIVSNGTQANLQFNNDNFIGSIDNVSVKEYITATNTPRLDYSTGAEAFLLEPQSTNLLTYSEDYSNVAWTKTGSASVTSNTTISPDGTQNADTLNLLSGNFFYQPVVGVGTFTLSCYVKAPSGTLDFKMQSFNGTDGAIQSPIFVATTEWQRFEHTVTVTVNSSFYPIQVSGLVGGDFEIWGAQVEQQSYPTSYIPTSGTSVTRNQETCINATPEINSEEGVLYFEGSALANEAVLRSISLSDGTTQQRIFIRYSSSENQLALYSIEDGNVRAIAGTNSYNLLEFNKIAISYKQNNFKFFVNGTKISEDNSGNTPTLLNKLSFNGGSGEPFFGNTKDLQVYTKALSDAELIKLTT